MKKIIILMSIVFLCACEKCDCGENNTNNNQSVENKDEYYVKYTAWKDKGQVVSNPYMTITIEDGSTLKINSSGGQVTKTIGPVKRGFTASISSNFPYKKIECCKNNGPFIVKLDKAGSYTIDF